MLSNFSSKKTDKEAPSAPSRSAAPRPSANGHSNPQRGGADRAPPSVIGPDLTIIGDLISNGEVQVDGEVQGDLHGTHIVVGEKARISGGVIGDEVVIRGHIMGSVRGNKIMLQSSSHVEGDVHHQSLAIEQGAYFEGKSRRTENPLEGVQRPVTSITSE